MGGRGASSVTARRAVDFFGGRSPGEGLPKANGKQEDAYRRIVSGDKNALKGFSRTDLDVFTSVQLQEIGRRMGLYSRAIINTSVKKSERADAVWYHMLDIARGGRGHGSRW